MEDKQKICDLLLPALQATKYYGDLVDLEYIADQNCVIGTFASGSTGTVTDVSFRSGRAMILNIVENLKHGDQGGIAW